jgi:hypothetical protein
MSDSNREKFEWGLLDKLIEIIKDESSIASEDALNDLDMMIW